jgi:glycosyltransferase involved in cell wall biosynthesis
VQAATYPSQLGKETPRVSIVLPLFNSSKELPSALSELEKQSYLDREIIIVDDGSSDATYETAAALVAGREDVYVVRTPHGGPAHARNEGLKLSRGEIVFFSESDCVYEPTYLQKAIDSLDSSPGAGAVCLTGAPLVTRYTLATRCIDIENKVQRRLLEQGKIGPFYAWVFRRSVLLRLGGFDEKLFQAEDRDLFDRLKKANYSVAWVPGVNWWHVRDQTLSQMSSKWVRRGRTRLLYVVKNRRVADAAKSILPFWATVVGAILLFRLPLVGVGILLLVAALFVGRTVEIARISWSSVERKRSFLGYLPFIIVRNFSTAVGYSLGTAMIVARRIQGKEVTWENL